MSRLSIIVTTLNAFKKIDSLFSSLMLQVNRNFDLIIVDANSTDGTIEFIRNSSLPVQLIISPGAGIYEGINTGIHASTNEYYLVCGSDDELLPDAVGTILSDISNNRSDLLLYAVKKDGIICQPNMPSKLRRVVGWQSIVASHSVGAVIKKELHDKLGYYDVKYKILADGHFFSNVFNTKSAIFISRTVVGRFDTTGISHRNLYSNIFTTFLIQIEVSPFFYQLCLLIYRLVKYKRYLINSHR